MSKNKRAISNKQLEKYSEILSQKTQDKNSEIDSIVKEINNIELDKLKKETKYLLSICYTEIFRIYAPDIPCEKERIQDIFSLILEEFKDLKDESSEYYCRAYKILENLNIVKSSNLILQIDETSFFVKFFECLINLISSSTANNVIEHIVALLTSLIYDCETIPDGVLQILLDNIDNQKKIDNDKIFCACINIFQRAKDDLMIPAQYYFQKKIFNNMQEINHKIIDCLSILIEEHATFFSSLYILFSQKLNDRDKIERLYVIRLLKELSIKIDSLNFLKTNNTLYESFLGRFTDKCLEVRIECLKFCNVSDVINQEELIKHVIERLYDPEESVRSEAVISVISILKFDYVAEESLKDKISERLRDKKTSVRNIALRELSDYYKYKFKLCYEDETSYQNIIWILNAVMKLYYQDDPQEKLNIEKVFFGYLVPCISTLEIKLKSLILAFKYCDEHTKLAIEGIFKIRSVLRKEMIEIVELASNKENTIEDDALMPHIIVLSRNLPDSFKMQETLKKLYNSILNSDRSKQLISSSLNIESSPVKKVIQAMNDSITHFTKNGFASDKINSIFDKIAPVYFDTDCVNYLLSLVEESPKKMDNNTIEALDRIFILFTKTQSEAFNISNWFDFISKNIAENHKDVSSIQLLKNTINILSSNFPSKISLFVQILSRIDNFDENIDSYQISKCLIRLISDKHSKLNQIIEGNIQKFEKKQGIRLLYFFAAVAKTVPARFKELKETILNENTLTHTKIAATNDEKIKALIYICRNYLIGDESFSDNKIMDYLLMVLHDSKKKSVKFEVFKCLLKMFSLSHIYKKASSDIFCQICYHLRDEMKNDKSCDTSKTFELIISYCDKFILPIDFFSMLIYSYSFLSKINKDKIRTFLIHHSEKRRNQLKYHSKYQNMPQLILPEHCLTYIIYYSVNDHSFKNEKDWEDSAHSLVGDTMDIFINENKEQICSLIISLIDSLKKTSIVLNNKEIDETIAQQRINKLFEYFNNEIVDRRKIILTYQNEGTISLPKKYFTIKNSLVQETFNTITSSTPISYSSSRFNSTIKTSKTEQSPTTKKCKTSSKIDEYFIKETTTQEGSKEPVKKKSKN